MEEITNKIIIKIAILGPESTGKSTLAKQLAEHFHTVFVPEYARQYLNELDRDYEFLDLKKIAKGQMALEKEKIKHGNKLIFCDTELTVLKIWSELKYGKCDPWILNSLAKQEYDLYLLMDTEIDWSPDPLREHQHLRDNLLELYKIELNERQIPFKIISGTGDKRFSNAINIVNDFLNKHPIKHC